MTSRLSVLLDATSSPLLAVPPEPFGVVEGPDGGIYVCDVANHRIVRVDRTTGAVEAVVGRGEAGSDGDGGPATEAAVLQPYEVRFDAGGNLLFVDMEANVVRRVDAATGTITTIAGTGEEGFSGDGGPATAAALAKPHSIELRGRRLVVADIANHRLRVVDLDAGTIDTLAGDGSQEPLDPERPLADNALNGPRAVAFDVDGTMVLALREGNAVYRVELSAGAIHHVAGTGAFGWDGDGGDARQARLAGPKGIALTPGGAIVLADTESHTVRVVLADGTIETVAGNGERGPSTDPAGACLDRPHGVFVDGEGAILIGDSDNRRLVRLTGWR